VAIRRAALAAAFAGLLLASCSTTPEHEAYRQHEDDHHHAAGELLVLDPPGDYVAALPDMEFRVIEVTDLGSLGGKLYHIEIADDRHPFVARDHHRQRFPGVKADVHHHHFLHATKKTADKTYTARGATKWQSAGTACGAGLRIGVIDGGVDVRHEAFKGTGIEHRSFIAKDAKPSDTSHGTAVAAVLGGRGHWGGLLPAAELRTANVFHRDAAGRTLGSTKAILYAVDWLVAEKVAVINLSFGGASNVLVQEALDRVNKMGIVLVASGGNDGPFSKKKSYPAAYDSVIAVTALDRFERSARFSSKGDYLEFAAPGVDIWTAVPPGGRPMSGTSFASPIIAGFAAAATRYKKLSGTEAVRKYLREHAKDKSEKGRDKYTGWGLVQLPPPC
jgi:subtilisin family serine protease